MQPADAMLAQCPTADHSTTHRSAVAACVQCPPAADDLGAVGAHGETRLCIRSPCPVASSSVWAFKTTRLLLGRLLYAAGSSPVKQRAPRIRDLSTQPHLVHN
eukprot:364869-Chlamydomonas_euryale.AAC.19